MLAVLKNWLLMQKNKVIDDFLKKLYKIGEHRDFDWEDMYELAEQLKAGEK